MGAKHIRGIIAEAAATSSVTPILKFIEILYIYAIHFAYRCYLPSYMVRNKMNTLPKLLTIATLIIYTFISGIDVDLDDSIIV